MQSIGTSLGVIPTVTEWLVMCSGTSIRSVMEEYKEMKKKRKAVVGELRRKGDTLCKERISPSSCGDMSTLTTRKGILCRSCLLEMTTSLALTIWGIP